MPAIEKSGLVVTDLENLRFHYAQTHRLWRQRFSQYREDIWQLYDERLYCILKFCLAGAEPTFRRQREIVYQIQIAATQTALPLTQDYMFNGAVSFPSEIHVAD